MTKYRKIKNLRKMPPKTKKQLEASRKSGLYTMLVKNPMKNPESVKKMSDKIRGKILSPQNLFKKGNKFGKLRKGIKMNEEQKRKISLKKIGVKTGNYEGIKAMMKKSILEGNPMRNPKYVKKFIESRRKKFDKEVLDKIIQDFNAGCSIRQLAKEHKVDQVVLAKMLRRIGVKYTSKERKRMYLLGNKNPMRKLKGGKNEKNIITMYEPASAQ